MAGISRFQDLVAWQRAIEVNDLVCELTESGKAARDLEFKSQIRTAAAKVGPLIAEGFVRFTDPEFVRYLRMARAEMAEVQAHLEQGARRGYCTAEQRSRLVLATNRAMGTITNLLKAKLAQCQQAAAVTNQRRRR